MPTDTTREQLNAMLQNLLADRMGLKVHWASNEITMYDLVVAKGGPKLKVAAPDSPAGGGDASRAGPPRVGTHGFPIPPSGNAEWFAQMPDGRVGMRAHAQTVPELVKQIALNGPINDATGLTGKYDYTLFYSMPATLSAINPTSTAEPNGPSIFEAVQEQLGLEIKKVRRPAQVLFVDHVNKQPTEN